MRNRRRPQDRRRGREAVRPAYVGQSAEAGRHVVENGADAASSLMAPPQQADGQTAGLWGRAASCRPMGVQGAACANHRAGAAVILPVVSRHSDFFCRRDGTERGGAGRPQAEPHFVQRRASESPLRPSGALPPVGPGYCPDICHPPAPRQLEAFSALSPLSSQPIRVRRVPSSGVSPSRVPGPAASWGVAGVPVVLNSRFSL